MAKPLNANVTFTHGRHALDFALLPDGSVTVGVGYSGRKPLYHLPVPPERVTGLGNFLGAMAGILGGVASASKHGARSYPGLVHVAGWITEAPIMVAQPCEYFDGEACPASCTGSHLCPGWATLED